MATATRKRIEVRDHNEGVPFVFTRQFFCVLVHAGFVAVGLFLILMACACVVHGHAGSPVSYLAAIGHIGALVATVWGWTRFAIWSEPYMSSLVDNRF